MNNWLNEITRFIRDKKASGLTNWYGLEIWNEPDGTWKMLMELTLINYGNKLSM